MRFCERIGIHRGAGKNCLVMADVFSRTDSKQVMALTADLVALCERYDRRMAEDEVTTIAPSPDLSALARRLADESGAQPLWTFAYGSLIWKPSFDALEQRRGEVFGWHRAFCLELTSWRACNQQSGLMMALQRGGRCHGMVYRLHDDQRVEQIERLLRREIDAEEQGASIRWVNVHTAEGLVRALAFWVGPSGREVVSDLSPQTVAERIARACGPAGSCADYLYRTVLHLEKHGIRDRNLWRLQDLVAKEIRRLYAVAA